MQHRNLLCTSGKSEMEQNQVWNHLHSERHLQSERVAISGVMNSTAYPNLAPRTNDYPSSSLSLEIPHNVVPTSGTSRDAYLHPSASGSSSHITSNYAQHESSFYRIHGEQDRTLNSQMEIGRGAFKRKNPAISTVYDGTSTRRYHGSGSGSSAASHSSDHFHQKPLSGSPHWPCWDPNSMVPNFRGNNLVVCGEGSQRNVRSRHTDAIHLEGNLSGTHISSNLPFHLHSTVDFPGPIMPRQWSHNPGSMVSHGRLPSSDAGGSSNEMNQSFSGSCISSGSWEIDGQYHRNIVPSRNSSAPMPVFRGPSTQGMGGGISYGQTTAPRYMPSYPPLGPLPTSLENGGRLAAPEGYSRHSRPLSIGGGNNYDRNGRARNLNSRFHSLSDENNVRGRFVSEGVVMMDRSTFYGSRNLYDQHHDMRLDIDNMSYEELLALEERIGSVNTGLSEEMISKCLTWTICSSSHQTQEDEDDGHCVICLEGYRDSEALGSLICGHEFHVSCIKQWLLVKNICPICKAPALKDDAS